MKDARRTLFALIGRPFVSDFGLVGKTWTACRIGKLWTNGSKRTRDEVFRVDFNYPKILATDTG